MKSLFYLRTQGIIRWLVGLLFIAAAIPKIAAPQDFALTIFRYHLLSDNLINLGALWLPWVEVTAAITFLLAASLWRQTAAALLAILLVLFTIVIIISLARGLDITCGCFTLKPGLGRIGAWSIARNIMLFVLMLWAVWGPAMHHKPEAK